MLKLDLHIHSHYSEDAEGSPKEIIKILKKRKLDGAAITDHNTIKGSLEALKLRTKDFIVIPGVEVSTKDGHVIALGVKEDFPRDLSLEETIDLIIDEGGIIVVPHLFRMLSGIKVDKLIEIKNKISVIEVFNSCSTAKSNIKSMEIAKKLNLGGTGGSDSHVANYVGYGYTVFNTTDYSIDSLIAEIENKKTWGEGSVLPLAYRRDRVIKSIRQFFQRGLKRI